MNPSGRNWILPCTVISSNVWKRIAVKKNTRHGKMNSSKKRSARTNTRLRKKANSIMLRNVTLAILLAWGSWSNARAADLKVLPTDMVLTGPRARQQLLALAVANGKVIGDLTDKAQFTSSNPAVATVNESGAVRAACDGEAIITASFDGKCVTAKVRVAKAKDASAPSFRNDVIPLLTKIGCNSGACHGA